MKDVRESKDIVNGKKLVLLRTVNATKAQPEFIKGSVGMVVKAPTPDDPQIRLRFPNGHEGVVNPEDLQEFDQYQQEQTRGVQDEPELFQYVVYKAVVGSRAYGLDHEHSDTDLRGVYLPPAQLHWSLFGIPEQLERKETDECYWELEKFLKLALKANPNILEVIATPLVEKITPLMQELRDMRRCFLSKLAFQTYNGYVISQFKKMTYKYARDGQVRIKHAMHLIRLLYAGIHIMNEKDVLVHVGDLRGELLAIKHEETSWDEVNRKRERLHDQFEQAYRRTDLPETPDYKMVDAFLVKARRHQVEDL